jgi:mono/diheme cytochrome c family protein
MKSLAPRTFAVAACLAAVLASSARAQGPKPAGKPVQAARPAASAAKTPSRPSTLSGVYTNEQAGRGKNLYTGTCRSCHSPTSHTGATFAQWWRGKPLSDLFTFISERMPKNDPGTLAPEDVADVVAYLLKMNAMPVGKNELYPDADSLKKFRIDVKSSGTSTATRKKP